VTLIAAIILGIVEGLTEFLPVSSTGHLTIVSRMLGYDISDPGITAFTAVIQVGAIIAVIIYFWSDIKKLAIAWFRGLFHRELRADPEYRMAWLVIIGSLPIAIVGFALRHVISDQLRSLWVVAFAMIIWGGVMLLAEAVAKQDRGERDLNLSDSLLIGFGQCLALIPGVSRSGATISIGLMRGLDRVSATRLSFLLGIPALIGAGGFELPDALRGGTGGGVTVGWLPTLVATVVSFIVAYASVAWLLKFVAGHKITWFVWYRWTVAAVLIIALSTGALAAT
jgi:undecaprenyl-diphosphatase